MPSNDDSFLPNADMMQVIFLRSIRLSEHRSECAVAARGMAGVNFDPSDAEYFVWSGVAVTLKFTSALPSPNAVLSRSLMRRRSYCHVSPAQFSLPVPPHLATLHQDNSCHAACHALHGMSMHTYSLTDFCCTQLPTTRTDGAFHWVLQRQVLNETSFLIFYQTVNQPRYLVYSRRLTGCRGIGTYRRAAVWFNTLL